MEILDDIIKKLTEAADYTIKEAEKLTGAAKVKFLIAEEQSKLEAKLSLLGKQLYDELKDSGEEIPEAYRGLYDEISEKYEALEKLQAEQATARNLNICPGCGSKIGRDDAYCPKCGMKQEKDD